MTSQLEIVLHFDKGKEPESLGFLSEGQTQLLIQCFAGTTAPSHEIRRKAVAILDDIAGKKAWLMCPCTGKQERPIMYPRMHDGARTLVRNTDRAEHLHAPQKCPFYRLSAERKPPASKGSMARYTGAFGLLTESSVKEHDGENSALESESTDSGSSTRIPTLCRLLFRLLEDARLNEVSAKGLSNIFEQYLRLRGTFAHHHFDQDKSIPLASFTFNGLDHLNWFESRLRQGKSWPKPLLPQGFLIGVASEVESRTLFLSKGGSLEVEGELARFGEEATSGPFIVMALIGMSQTTGQCAALRAYAHPVFNGSALIPIDSNLERDTLTELMELQVWFRDTKNISFTIEKPLSEIKPINGQPVSPDFLLRVKDKLVVVETMGYDRQDYLDSKANTHPIMEKLGELVRYEHGGNTGTSFKSKVNGAIFRAAK
jgi:hypothetical protein